MKTVILCGGKGTRLREETEYRPKPMVPIGTRPILWHIMRRYALYGHKDFVLCLGYKGEQIRDYFRNYRWNSGDVTLALARPDAPKFHAAGPADDWKVALCDTGADSLTAWRVRAVRQHVGRGAFFLTYGDGVCNVDVAETIRFHREQGVSATLTAGRPTGRFGELSMEGSAIQAARPR